MAGKQLLSHAGTMQFHAGGWHGGRRARFGAQEIGLARVGKTLLAGHAACA
jgi:hypothetical protein